MSRENAKSIIKRKVKSHLPKTCLTELRILYRLAMETIYGIRRTGLMNIVIVSSMVAILTIFGALFRSTLSVSAFAKELGNVLEISAYLEQNADHKKVASAIKEIKHVQNIKYIEKSKSWAKLKTELDLAELDNPLPDTLHIKIDKPENIPAAFEQIKKVKGVEDLNYAKDIVQKMQIFNNVVSTMTVIVIAVIALLTIVIINNTIHAVIQLRKEEIEIMRLMGVSNWFIKTPLIAQGAIYGFTGAVLSLIPLNAVQKGLVQVHQFFMIPSPVLATNIVVFVLFIVAIGFGALGSYLSIKKHLQV